MKKDAIIFNLERSAKAVLSDVGMTEEYIRRLKAGRDKARTKCERWKRAVKEYHLHVIKNYNAGISLDASEAMRDGNLEALEAALKIHGEKKEQP